MAIDVSIFFCCLLLLLIPYRLLKKTHSDFYSRTCPFSPHEFEKRKRAQFILRVTPRSDRWRFNVHFQPLYFFLLGESIFKKEVNFVARGDRQIERRRERKEKRETLRRESGTACRRRTRRKREKLNYSPKKVERTTNSSVVTLKITTREDA